MDVQFQLKLPYSGWDYFPLPNVASSAEEYELIINFQLPAFVAKLFGVSVPSALKNTPVTYDSYGLSTESPLVAEARRLIESGNFELCKEGVGGTYFITGLDGSVLGIFKPTGTSHNFSMFNFVPDEEPGAPNNPKKVIKNPILPPGGGGIRELAAYLLDRNFAGVPQTYFLTNVHHKGFSTDGCKLHFGCF